MFCCPIGKDTIQKDTFPVAIRVGETPVNISNTKVKPYPAWDTALATVWESRWLPDICHEVAGEAGRSPDDGEIYSFDDGYTTDSHQIP